MMDVWLVKLVSLTLGAGVGPLQVYTGVHLSDVVGAYLLVALYLLPVLYLYGRDAEHTAVSVSADDESLIRHRMPSNPAFQALFD
jgi:membrane-associated phospholipid phosphatase